MSIGWKLFTVLLFALIAGFQTASCAKTGLQSFKGWEVYSWDERGAERFSILIGTNRLKSCAEIKAHPLQLHVLKKRLGELNRGEYVSVWRGHLPLEKGCSLQSPSQQSLQQIKQVCEACKLILQAD